MDRAFVRHLARTIWYALLRLLLPLGGEATARDIRRQVQPRLDRPLPTRVSSRELLAALAHRPFRSIFYARLRNKGIPGRVLAGLLACLYRGEPVLYFACGELGPGFMMMHGFSTIITARRIGTDCQVASRSQSDMTTGAHRRPSAIASESELARR
jgi:hypothetical protein